MYTRLDHKKRKSWTKIGFSIAAVLIFSVIGLSLTKLSPLNSNAHALGSNTTDFVTTWQTTTTNESITIPINSDYAGGYNYNVDWGDGNTSANITTSTTHQYATAGRYQVRINGLFPAIRLSQSDANNQARIISIDQWGNNHWQSMYGAFYGAINLTYTATDVPDLSGVTDMTGMFLGDSQFNGAIGNWDVSHITDMQAVFYDAKLFNQSLASWNTANVTDMSFMFAGYTYQMIFNQDLSGWNTANVTDMASMFQSNTYFNQDLSLWSTSKVTNMSYMFSGDTAFNGNISSWNVSQVTDMSYMFYGATAFNQSLNLWNTGSATTMTYMFYNATSFNQDLNKWNTTLVTDMSRMFGGSNAMIFNGDISSWNTGRVTNMSDMFSNDTTSSFNRDISNWNVGSVTNMRGMFYNDIQFNQNLNLWNTGSVTTMTWMFGDATAFNGDISTWDTSRVTDTSYMFYGATDFNQAISGWNVSNVTDMNHMFNGATAFNQSLDSWNVSKVANMQSMFQSATAFNQDLNNWKTTSLTNTRSLFDTASNFNGNISNWDVSHVTEMWATFKYATSFNQDISKWNTSSATDMKWVFLGASSFNHDLSNWNISNATDLTYFFYQTGLSQSNYEATLIGWSKQNVKPNVPLYANNQTYCSTAAQAARNILTSTPNSWVITGDSLNCSMPGNQAPVASNKNIITILGEASINTFPASDPDGNNLYFDITSQPSHGTVVINLDGSFTYTPNPSYIGNDSFSYKTRDQQVSSNVATISIYVGNPAIVRTNGKALTNNANIPIRPTFSGTAPANTTITVTVHSDPVICSTTADANGNWSCSLPTNLTPGEHTVRVMVTYAGNIIQELGPYTVLVSANGTSPVLSPDTGYGVEHKNWQLKLMVTIAVALVLISLGALGLRRATK